MKNQLSGLFCFLLLAIGFLRGQVTHFRNATSFGPAEGVTENPTDITQDDQGFIWLATHRGLFRFDGVHATKIHLPVADSLAKRCDNIYDLCFDPVNQLLWLGTDGGLLYYGLRTGVIRHFHPNNYYAGKDRELQATHAVLADRQGEIWAEFGKYGFAHLSVQGELLGTFYLPLNEQEKATGFDEKMANTVLDISQDPIQENILWMNTRRGLLRFDKKNLQLVRYIYYPDNEKMLTPANSMTSHYAHQNGYLYIGTWNAGLLKLDPKTGHFTQLLRRAGIWKEGTSNAFRITSLVPDKKGQIWTNGTDGAALFDVQKEQFNFLPQTEIAINFQDRDGNYWDMQQGLQMYHHQKNQGKWEAYTKDLPCEPWEALLFDSRNREVFLKGFCRDGAFWTMNVDDQTFQRHSLPNRLKSMVFCSGETDSKSAYYLLESQKSEIYQRKEGQTEFEKIPVVFPINAGHLSMTCSPSGDLFVTGHTGWLFWLKPPDSSFGRKEWQMSSFSKSTLGGTLTDDFHAASSPVFDMRGKLWILNSRGFSVFSTEESAFQHFKIKPASVKHLESYNSFVPEGERMWASGKGGFGWFDIEKPKAGLQKSYKPKGNFRQDEFVLHSFIRDKLWLKTSEGWAEFDPQKETFRYFDFLKANDLVYIGEGRLLTHEGDGFRLLHLDSLQVAEEIPQPYVSWFKVFERLKTLPVALQSAPPLHLKPNENFFSIGFSALATYNTAGIRFAYQLDGVNPAWVFPDPDVRAASFTNIEGGDYTFKIKTTNSRGEWLENVFQLKIQVGTPWYKTWWFRLTVIAVLGGIGYYLAKNRLRQQQILLDNQRLQLEKEQSLRKERDRIATEMHDEMGTGLSTIRFLSFAAKEKETDPDNAARIERITQQAAKVMEQMSDIIWAMNSRNDTLENFVAYLRGYAAELLATHGIRFILEVPADLPKLQLGGEKRRSILLAMKECLHNVVKHSGATEVKLIIHTPGHLEIILEDNGRGLHTEKLARMDQPADFSNGNGLLNIRQRMASLGGTAIFENGNGFKVILRCPHPTV